MRLKHQLLLPKMSSQSTAVATASESTSSSFAGKLQYIHVACEVLIIGIVYFILNKRITALQSDLVECAVRIASQNKKMAEMESKIEQLSAAVDAVSRRPPPMPMMMPPMPPMMPTRPVPQQQGSSFQPFPVVSNTPGSFYTEQPAARPIPAAVPDTGAPSSAAGPDRDISSPDVLDRELAAELNELGATSQ